MTESSGGRVPSKSPPRSAGPREQLQADVAAARQRLSDDIETLIGQVHPKAVASRAVNGARDRLDAGVGAAKQRVSKVVGAVNRRVSSAGSARRALDESYAQAAFFRDEHGWRSDRFVLIGGMIAGVVTLALPLVAMTVAIRKAVRAHKKSAEDTRLRREPASSLVRPSRLSGVEERSDEHSPTFNRV